MCRHKKRDSQYHKFPEKGMEVSGAQIEGLMFAARRNTSTILSEGKEDCVGWF